jgi:flagellar protein FlgJ
MFKDLPPLEDLIKELKDIKDVGIKSQKHNNNSFDKSLQTYLNQPKQNVIKPIKSYFDLKSIQESKTPEEVANTFQTIFFEMMLKEMKNGLFEFSSSDFGNKMYMDMFFMQLAQVMADSNQIGLKDYILNAINNYTKNSKPEG